MSEKKLTLISLGCEKNLVDSEMILGLISHAKYEIINDVSQSDLIIVNTCGFIESAKKEAIDTIFDCINQKKKDAKLVVTGCLVQRYLDDLKKDIPEVDLWVPIRDYFKLGTLLDNLFNDNTFNNLKMDFQNRIISTPNYLAYVRIGDGCNNRCAYCAIPLIRGNLKSREKEDIIKEVKDLVDKGYLEICLISQDLSNYGYDINTTLTSLLKDLVKIEKLKWLRLLYLYPDEISDEFIEVVRDNPKILPYFDIPLQHASDKILKQMHRRGNKEYVIKLIKKIRDMIPNAIIRTTMIVGFPHETENDVLELIDFMKQVRFNHLGAFMYSKEEDTLAYNMSHQVSKKDKIKRYNMVMDEQKWISYSLNKEMIGKHYECILEKYNQDDDTFVGRTYAFAPDDIDGEVIIYNDHKYNESEVGTIKNIVITDATFYDLIGEFK